MFKGWRFRLVIVFPFWKFLLVLLYVIMASRFTFPPQRDQGIGFTFPMTNTAENADNNQQISIDIDPSSQNNLIKIDESPRDTFPLQQSVANAPIIDIPSPIDTVSYTHLDVYKRQRSRTVIMSRTTGILV